MLGRAPTFTELGIVSALWNEHCSYKHSRTPLKTLPTKAPYVLQGPGENAGVICDRRWPRGRLQDRVAQPSVRGRAVSGRRDRCRRHTARRLHDGRAPDRDAQLAAVRVARLAARPLSVRAAWSRESATTAIASAFRRSRGEIVFDPAYEGNPLVNAMCVGLLHEDGSDSRRGRGRRQRDHGGGRAHGTRWHSRRVVRVGGPLRRRARQSARRCRSAIRSPRSSCSRRASS